MQLEKYCTGTTEGRKTKKRESSKALLYSDDLGARESASTMKEMEEKTKKILGRLYQVLKDSRQAVKQDKTQIMCLASSQRRKVIKEERWK